jgi:hypothetical protein
MYGVFFKMNISALRMNIVSMVTNSQKTEKTNAL